MQTQVKQTMSRSAVTYGRNVFVLDISGSMAGKKCQTLQLSARRLIEDIRDMSYVGIVLFDGNPDVAHRLVQITDRRVRDRVIQSVPAVARGGTDISCGILKGVSLFADEGISTIGATMFLITDGEDGTGSSPNYVDRVLPTLLNSKIRVVCIAIGNEADPELERLARETSGRTYAASGTNQEMAARVIAATIQEVNVSTELAEVMNICVCDESLVLSQTVVKNITIDSDIGRNTVFTIGSVDFDKISVSIQSPNGKTYDSSSPELTRNDVLKRYQLTLNSTEPGVWSLTVRKHSNQTIAANVSVKSQPLNPKAIQLNIKLKDADNESPPIIITELMKGRDVVVGADVTATIDRPNGTQTQLKLINYNNIYCNYFTDYCGLGRYSVTVKAQSGGQGCQLKSLSTNTNVNQSVPQFERQLIVGCFKITNSMPQRPNDQKLQELSLTSEFNCLSMNASVSCVETPAPRTAKAVINERRRAVPMSDDIKQKREKLNVLVFIVKKSMNSLKISNNERQEMKKSIEELNNHLSSQRSSLLSEDLDQYIKQFEAFQQKLI